MEIPMSLLYLVMTQKRSKYLRAIFESDLLHTYSLQCGAKMPLRLRGTKLRKHIATKCITLNLSDPDITQLANYMGHDKNIHMQHYRQPIPQMEIVKMSRLFKLAQGESDNNEQDEQNNPHNVNKTDLITINEICEADNCTNSDNNSGTDIICDTVNKRKRRSSKCMTIIYSL